MGAISPTLAGSIWTGNYSFGGTDEFLNLTLAGSIWTGNYSYYGIYYMI